MSDSSDPTSDQKLVERCRTGSESAATELFNRYVSRLLGVARGGSANG